MGGGTGIVVFFWCFFHFRGVGPGVFRRDGGRCGVLTLGPNRPKVDAGPAAVSQFGGRGATGQVTTKALNSSSAMGEGRELQCHRCDPDGRGGPHPRVWRNARRGVCECLGWDRNAIVPAEFSASGCEKRADVINLTNFE